MFERLFPADQLTPRHRNVILKITEHMRDCEFLL